MKKTRKPLTRRGDALTMGVRYMVIEVSLKKQIANN